MDLHKNPDGTDNLAPYSQFTNLTFDPPLVIFSANQNVVDDRKNTVKTLSAPANSSTIWYRTI